MANTKKANPTPAQLHIPSNFFTFDTFKTLAGSAGVVWICCLVIGSLIPKSSLNCYQWRYIALLLSEMATIGMLLRSKKRKLENWFLTILNELLVFINASGLNAISTGMAFVDKDNSDIKSAHTMSLFTFTKEIAWWPDATLINDIKKQKQECNIVKEENDSLKKQIDTLCSKVNKLQSNQSNVDTIAKHKIDSTSRQSKPHTHPELPSPNPKKDNDTVVTKKIIPSISASNEYTIYKTINCDGVIYHIVGKDSKYGAVTDDTRQLQIPMIYPSAVSAEAKLRTLLGILNSNEIGL
jgi:hypothetical protein